MKHPRARLARTSAQSGPEGQSRRELEKSVRRSLLTSVGHGGLMVISRALLPWGMAIGGGALHAQTDPVGRLLAFTRHVRSAQASFVQTVTSADGNRRKRSEGRFEFSRPGRFRFDYTRPNPQLIVSDGERIWLVDPELQQASWRPYASAAPGTAAALLAGEALERDFELSAQESTAGLSWVLARPKARAGGDANLSSVRVGWRGDALAVIELTDTFGQKSELVLNELVLNPALPPDRFQFKPPKDMDVIGPKGETR